MNIVFITVDAWRYDALGLAPDKHWLERYGLCSRLYTPNLDQFAADGAYFTQALASAPHTTVSLASVMTGLFPPQHGVRSFFYECLPAEVKTLAEVLRDNGYATITLRESEDVSQPGILQKVDVLRGFDVIVHDLRHLATATQEMKANQQPVFAFLHLWDVHAPYLYSEWGRRRGVLGPFREKVSSLAKQWGVKRLAEGHISERAAMDFQKRVAECMDDATVRIKMLFEWYVDGVNWFDEYRWPALEMALKDGGLWDNTVIVVFGDHGEGVHPDGGGVKVFDHGQSLLDDVLRTPLLVHGPGVVSRRIDDQVSLVDLVPTVLDLAGLAPDEHFEVEDERFSGGRSLLPLLSDTNSTLPARLHFAELCVGGASFSLSRPSPQHLYQRCVRGGGYKFLYHDGPVLMRRYREWQEELGRLWRKLIDLAGKSKARHSSDDPANCSRLYWTDLQADPDELLPRRWGRQIPVPVVRLRSALDELYAEAERGPALDLTDWDESAVLQRLEALGYVE